MTKKYQKEVVTQLKVLGFKHIKRYSFSTWKYYGEDHVRLIYLVTYDKSLMSVLGKEFFIFQMNIQCMKHFKP